MAAASVAVSLAAATDQVLEVKRTVNPLLFDVDALAARAATAQIQHTIRVCGNDGQVRSAVQGSRVYGVRICRCCISVG